MSAGLTSPRLCRCCCTLLTSATLQSAGSCTTAGRRLSSRSFSSRWVAEVVQRVATAGHSWPGVSRSRGSVQCAVQTQTNQLFFFYHVRVVFRVTKKQSWVCPSPRCVTANPPWWHSPRSVSTTAAETHALRTSAFSVVVIPDKLEKKSSF